MHANRNDFLAIVGAICLFVVELYCVHKKCDRWKIVGPAMNNYLLVERAQVARRDSDRLGGGGGLTTDTGSAFGPVSAPVVSSTKEEDPLVSPPPTADEELWRRWWTSLEKTALNAARNKAATVSLRKERRSQPESGRPLGFESFKHKLAVRFRFYETMDSISLRSGVDKSRDSDESDAESELYGFRPPDGIVPLQNMMRNRFPRTSFFDSEDLPFRGAIAEGEANAGDVYSYLPIDIARRGSTRCSTRAPLSKNLFRKSNDSGIDRGEGKFQLWNLYKKLFGKLK